jgi:hypothetical protein
MTNCRHDSAARYDDDGTRYLHNGIEIGSSEPHEDTPTSDERVMVMDVQA